MAGKRQATSNLNHENWDQEEEPEERGTFRTAPPEELKARVIKKATRRTAVTGASGAGEADGANKSVFSGFSGFGKPASTTSSSSPFAFLSKLPAAAASASATSIESSSKASNTAKNDEKLTPPRKTFSLDPSVKCDFKVGGNSGSNNTSKATPITSIFGKPSAEPPKTPMSMFKASVPADKPTVNNSSNVPLEFRNNVAELNMAVMKFLQTHMDKNPYCILTPVFESYDKYLKELRSKSDIKSNTESDLTKTQTTSSASLPAAAPSPATPAAGFFFGKPTTPSTGTDAISSSSPFDKKPTSTVTSGSTATTASATLFSFGNIQKPPSLPITTPTKSEATSSTAPPASIFSFGMKSATTESKKDETPKPGFFFGGQSASSVASPPKTNGFSFGLKADDKPSTSGFAGFGKPAGEGAASSGFSFTPASSTFASSENVEEEEEDKPPVVEFKQVVEDDAIFSKRCKVFVKKDKDFTDRGVGTLYLKPVKDSEKTQMLVRAATNLGNILVNLILSEGLPCQRMGKNNVMMVCIPTPEETKAMSMLLRVKTAEEADELLEQIKSHIA